MIMLTCMYKINKMEFYRINSKIGMQNPADNFQKTLYNGLLMNNELCKVINVPPVGSYPRHFKKIVMHYDDDKKSKWIDIGFLNIPFIKQYMCYNKIQKILKTVINEKILIYSADLVLLKGIKKIDESNRVILIVPDLPEYYDYQKKKNMLRSLYTRLVYKNFFKIDKYILLTKYMAEKLPVNNLNWMIMEGIVNLKTDKQCDYPKLDNKTIFYSGSINELFGIKELINSFKRIKHFEYRLLICGNGDYKNELLKIAKEDSRIIYLGEIPREEVIEYQRKASLLVNPRIPKGDYTKYSFPSKTMEYLLSSTPVIMFKLPGIPDEYDLYVNYFKNDDCNSMALDMDEIIDNYEMYLQKAKLARDFIIKEKNELKQTKRILDFIYKE